MEYKTILVQLDQPERVSAVAGCALNLANKFDSLLTGVFIMPSLAHLGSLVSGGAGPGVVRQRRDELTTLAEQCEVAFRSLVQSTEREWAWSVVEAEQELVAEALVDRAKTVDLVVLSQTAADEDVLFVAETPERLILESGRPVVIVPHNYHPGEHGFSKVLVAWDGSKEATRAMADSISVLKRAHTVRVVWLVENNETVSIKTPVMDRLKSLLAQHGIEAAADFVLADGADVPSMLGAMGQEGGYDLLVCGGYGESRLKEFLLGGATRYLLNNSTVPLFMAH